MKSRTFNKLLLLSISAPLYISTAVAKDLYLSTEYLTGDWGSYRSTGQVAG